MGAVFLVCFFVVFLAALFLVKLSKIDDTFCASSKTSFWACFAFSPFGSSNSASTSLKIASSSFPSSSDYSRDWELEENIEVRAYGLTLVGSILISSEYFE